MSSALESRDRWSRSANQAGQLLLGELVPHPELDEQTGNGLRSGEPRSDLAVRRVRLLVAADVIGNTVSNRPQASDRHGWMLSLVVTSIVGLPFSPGSKGDTTNLAGMALTIARHTTNSTEMALSR